jgi:uncharacterized membrane protein YheB (UPF0754 family)
MLQSKGLQQANHNTKEASYGQKDPLVGPKYRMNNVLELSRSDSLKTPAERVLYFHNLDQTVGRLSCVCPASVGQEIENLKQDVVNYSLEELPKHTQEIERYMDEVMKIKDTLSWRLQRITPTEFEDIVHPIFRADEWILLAVGGFLGIVIGLLQAFALQHIGA